MVTPLALIGLSLFDLTLRGRAEVDVVETNPPALAASTGIREVDLVHPTSPAGRVYRVEVAPRTDGAAPPEGTRVQLQLESAGRTRLIVVRPETDNASRLRALVAVAAGGAVLQMADDREWIDLGPLPSDGSPLRVYVIGLLPGSFAFAEPNQPADSVTLERIAASLVPSREPVGTSMPRYRLVRNSPASGGEMLARATFFVRESRLLAAASLLGAAGLCTGWVLLQSARAWSAIFLLVASVVLVHAALLPPLQGADETSQVGTLEWLVADPSPRRAWRYPDSVSLVAQALEQDRVQYQPIAPLPARSAAQRSTLAAAFASTPLHASATAVAQPPAADLQVIQLRAPLFFAAYLPLARPLAWLPTLDRITAYRMTAVLWGLASFGAGLALLRHARVPLEYGLAYGLAALLPYSVGVSATCSNYAVAIGIGFLCVAGVLAMIVGGSAGARGIGAGVALASAWAGVPIWPDFTALAIAASALTAAAGVAFLLRRAREGATVTRRPGGAAAVAGLLAVAAVAVAWHNFPWFDARLPGIAASWPRYDIALRVSLLAAPLVLAGLAVGFGALLRRQATVARGRTAVAASATIGAAVLALFITTPYTEVPYERVFLPLRELVAAHLAALWSNALSLDQDRLGWKFLFGTFGWHDTYYPEPVYALARWALVAIAIALPLLGLDAAARRPRVAALLLLTAGVGGTLAIATLLARHAMSIHPHGRFVLPWLPLVTIPLLGLVATPARRPALRAALRCGVALNVWTAIAVLGVRYWVQR